MTHFRLVSTLAVMALLSIAGCDKAADAPKVKPETRATPTPASKLRIAVIPKGTTHEFWKGVERGARKAGEELGVEIMWKGPLREDNLSDQITLVQRFVTDKVDGIVLAPLDKAGLVKPVQSAGEKQIPVVIMDSALEGEVGKDFVSFVGTNSKAAGHAGGEHLAKLIDVKAKAVVLRYLAGSASTTEREEGAIAGLKAGGVTIASDNQYAGADLGSAKNKALAMMDTIKTSQGVFCPNESSAAGMLLALKQSGLAGKVRFVGFDASGPLVEGLGAGEIDALVVQNPERMGYLAVKTLVAAIKKEHVEGLIDTGAVVVTKANMEQPEIKALIQ